MPVPTSILENLVSTGYRPITLKGFGELIGGVRYVGIEKTVLRRTHAVQLTPSAVTMCSFSVYSWDKIITSHCRHFSRSRIGEISALRAVELYDWFAKESEADINFGIKFPEKTRIHKFKFFISSNDGGILFDFGTSTVFNARHPIDPNSRLAVDLQRQKAELEAREAKVKQAEAFAEADEFKAIGAQYFANGNQSAGQNYFKAADDLRRRIQTLFLDQGKTVERLNPVIDVTTSSPRTNGVITGICAPAKQTEKPKYEPVIIGGSRIITFAEDED